MKRVRHRMLFSAFLAMGCLCETVGCPQLLGDAVRGSTVSFLNTGLTTVLLSSLNLNELLGLPT